MAEPFSMNGQVAVGAVKFPGPKVDQVTASLNRDSLAILRPGVAVGLEIGSVTDTDKVKTWLIEKINRAGWVYDEFADIKLFAEMGTLPSVTESYQRVGIGASGTTTVSYTPQYANLTIRQGPKVIWQAGTQTGAPMFAQTRNIQRTVNDAQVPQLDFFRTVELEPVVMDPKYANGFGLSKLGLRGIEVVSVTPPGREDDPEAAAKTEMEKRAKEKRPGEGEQPAGN
jgi:hypothetical protein